MQTEIKWQTYIFKEKGPREHQVKSLPLYNSRVSEQNFHLTGLYKPTFEDADYILT